MLALRRSTAADEQRCTDDVFELRSSSAVGTTVPPCEHTQSINEAVSIEAGEPVAASMTRNKCIACTAASRAARSAERLTMHVRSKFSLDMLRSTFALVWPTCSGFCRLERLTTAA